MEQTTNRREGFNTIAVLLIGMLMASTLLIAVAISYNTGVENGKRQVVLSVNQQIGSIQQQAQIEGAKLYQEQLLQACQKSESKTLTFNCKNVTGGQDESD